MEKYVACDVHGVRSLSFQFSSIFQCETNTCYTCSKHITYLNIIINRSGHDDNRFIKIDV